MMAIWSPTAGSAVAVVGVLCWLEGRLRAPAKGAFGVRRCPSMSPVGLRRWRSDPDVDEDTIPLSASARSVQTVNVDPAIDRISYSRPIALPERKRTRRRVWTLAIPEAGVMVNMQPVSGAAPTPHPSLVGARQADPVAVASSEIVVVVTVPWRSTSAPFP